MQDYRKKVGSRIRRLREARRLSQEEFAETSGIHHAFLAALEQGKVDPTVATLLRVALALRVSMSALVRGIEEISARP